MKFINNIYFKIVFSFILVAIIGVIIWLLLASLRTHQLLTNADAARKAGKPIPVSTVLAETGSLDSITAAECLVKESAQTSLSVDIGSKVINVNAALGDFVSKGQLLVKLDDSVLKASLQNTHEAEATLKDLKNELKPFITDLRELRKKNLIPIDTLIEAIDKQRRADLDLIRVRREKLIAEDRITNTSLLAPISGVLTRIEANVGTVLRPFESFIVLSQLDPILLECAFAEDAFTALNDFDKADATFPAFKGKATEVKLKKILPLAAQNTHAIIAQFDLPNKEHTLLPGMMSVVRISKFIEGLKIPSISLINPSGDSASVFVIDKNKVARFIKVGIGRYAQGYVEVKSGLEQGQKVVVVGQSALQDGDKVTDRVLESAELGMAKTLFRAESR